MSIILTGKDTTQGIKAIEPNPDSNTVSLFFNGGGEVEKRELDYYYLSSRVKYNKLEGNGFYKYAKVFDNENQYQQEFRQNFNNWAPRTPIQGFLLKSGVTLFKGLKSHKELNTLVFDIETNGLTMDDQSFIYLIACKINEDGPEQVFSYKDYPTQGALIEAFCAFLITHNPTVIVGHNILGYDLPFLNHCAKINGVEMRVGVDGSPIRFEDEASQFRKDGSQSYTYHKAYIYGRHIIDTFFLSIRYDVGRKYPSYALKEIIKFEGLVQDGRVFIDSGNIKTLITTDYDSVVKYALWDVRDTLTIYNKMIPPFFIMAQFVPISNFAEMFYTATGTQINLIMLRSYLQQGHSIPRPSPKIDYMGALSFGNAGVYKNVYKVDVASLYPSIILKYRLFNKDKDPQGHLYEITKLLTAERLVNKRRFKETGDHYYDNLQGAQKILINSIYGFLGAKGLHFNDPEIAATITARGREILMGAIKYCMDKKWTIVNADTDSVSFVPVGENVDMDLILADLNAIDTDGAIVWEDDGIYKDVIVVKAKNYYMDGKIKGSALKATNKERALKRFISDALQDIKNLDINALHHRYEQIVNDITNGQIDLYDWTTKKTITKKILNPKRSNESRVLDALKEDLSLSIQEGDKVYIYFNSKSTYKVYTNNKNDYYAPKLYEKLYKTVKIFFPLIPIDKQNLFKNYSLKKNYLDLIKK